MCWPRIEAISVNRLGGRHGRGVRGAPRYLSPLAQHKFEAPAVA
jgi:hypothetical protein